MTKPDINIILQPGKRGPEPLLPAVYATIWRELEGSATSKKERTREQETALRYIRRHGYMLQEVFDPVKKCPVKHITYQGMNRSSGPICA